MKKGNVSIRKKLMYSFLVTAGLMCITVVFVVIIVASIINSVSKSYETNSFLDSYSTVLVQTETALETYINVRSFDSIDTYYSYRSKMDSMTASFYSKATTDPVLLLEYKITRMAQSFLIYADRAIYARRANNISTAGQEYASALQIYGFLAQSVTELNTLYFQRNIARYNQTMEVIKTAGINCGILVLLVILLNFLLMWVLVTNITRPLVDISQVANRLAERDFDIPLLQFHSRDEVGNICRAFNRMIVSIREYIDTIWEKAVEENRLREREMQMTSLYKDAQLKALQSQINPHFLFNTLNTGVQLAMMEGADKTSYFIEQVADFFRYNIRYADKETTLTEEISLIDNYIYIMKVRFGNKFEYIKDLHTDYLQILLPGMVLQPIVEDCIKHGLKDVSRGGEIRLHVYDCDSFVCVEISDNGKGFSTESINQVMAQATNGGSKNSILLPSTVESETKTQSAGTGIGLVNVITRLQLYFHSTTVFSIQSGLNEQGIIGQSSSGQGTIFTIKIPQSKQETPVQEQKKLIETQRNTGELNV